MRLRSSRLIRFQKDTTFASKTSHFTYVAKFSRPLSPWRSKVKVIPNGVDVGVRQSPDAKLLAKAALGIPASTQLCLFVGALNRRKGVDVLLEAAHLVSRARPVIFVV